ncbi:MAG TPA: fasciclin domain-containing protein [Candidatus Eremiobacteraceae bacterium]|nr:fasciclin domain-containing protein [Candidatus Eremiobacteraceae bacterium]
MQTTGLKDIVDTAVDAGSFNTLAAAVGAAGLVDALKGPGPYTVFAPTDAAFAKLPAGTVDALLKDIPKLKSILTYHVVANKYMSSDVRAKTTLKTLQGQSIVLEPVSGGIKVNDAHVTQADIECSNGVIHVIDAVILPA